MAKTDKLTKKLLLFGVLGAAAVIVVSLIVGLEAKSMFSGIVVVWAILMVVRMYIINGRNKEYAQMLEHLNKILAEDNDPEKYIKKCNDYIEKVDDSAFKEMLKVNSAVGYSVMGKYAEAIEVIKSADLSKLNPSHRAVAINNIAQFSYFLGRDADGTKYVEDNFQVMQKYLSNKNFAATFMTTFSFYYYLRGNKSKAEKYTENVIGFIKNSGSSSEGDMVILQKMSDLLEKIKAMPDPEEIYDDDNE
ncbi:MAG: hypothetical protein KH033_02435 [Clostridiales bacterium]|nr:hypothetical protein [Clostridiales bacterium]